MNLVEGVELTTLYIPQVNPKSKYVEVPRSTFHIKLENKTCIMMSPDILMSTKKEKAKLLKLLL